MEMLSPDNPCDSCGATVEHTDDCPDYLKTVEAIVAAMDVLDVMTGLDEDDSPLTPERRAEKVARIREWERTHGPHP